MFSNLHIRRIFTRTRDTINEEREVKVIDEFLNTYRESHHGIAAS
ncbi:Protein of unknown function [Bacillus wiedmannii]|uniref:Uncharacterized protein n=1 Tax=Bacillus wiedmannii TaxID=1890302 RepID=A0AB37YR22_9BACI|nr:Protein of unknown function [Bacillus wiedmannii]